MASAPKYLPHYTTADYEQWEGDWELWSGVAVAMSPSPGYRHQVVAGRIFRTLAAALDEAGCDNCHAVYELDWRVTDDTVVRPDISLLCDPVPEAVITIAPRLIVEITSDSTAFKDRTAKRELYEAQGVRYYVIADPVSQLLEAWELKELAYQRFDPGAATTLALSESCRVTVDFSNIFASQPGSPRHGPS